MHARRSLSRSTQLTECTGWRHQFEPGTTDVWPNQINTSDNCSKLYTVCTRFCHMEEDEGRQTCEDCWSFEWEPKRFKGIGSGEAVRLQPQRSGEREWCPATVKRQLNGRDYEVQTAEGRCLRRNRQFIRTTKANSIPKQSEVIMLPST